MSRVEDDPMWLECPHCLHRHAGPHLGFICIGCPCQWTPAAPTSPRADADLALLTEKLLAGPEQETKCVSGHGWSKAPVKDTPCDCGAVRYGQIEMAD